MHPILLKTGPFTLHTYGLLVAVGFLAAFFVAKREFLERGIPVDFLDRNILWLMLTAIIGARVLYFAVDGFRELAAAPLTFFRIWEGGLVFYGGFLFGAAFLFFKARKWGIPLLSLTDALAAPLLLGQAFGRFGCFAAGCCYGRPTSSGLGVTFIHPEALAPRYIALHPTQLYSAFGDLLLLGGLMVFHDRLMKRGMSTVYYLIGYGAGRFLVEFLRNDDRGFVLLTLHPSQWISIVMIVAGLVLYGYEKRHAYR